MDGISQGARDGGANMSKDGRYATKAKDGDVAMPMDGISKNIPDSVMM